MKISLIITVLLISGFKLILINANADSNIAGQYENGFFKPETQYWQVVAVRPINAKDLPKDLGGVPFLLRGSPVYITPNYMTLKSINSGGDYIIPACYHKQGNILSVNTWGKSQRVLGKTFILTQSDDQLLLQYGKWFNLVLKLMPKPEDFDYRKKQLDATYNRIFDNGNTLGNNCSLAKVDIGLKEPQNLTLHFKDTNRTITLEKALLDPSTSLSQTSSRAAKPVDISERNLVEDGCKAEKQNLIAMSKRYNPNSRARGEFKDIFIYDSNFIL